LFFAPGTSQFSQPLDNKTFAEFKKALSRNINALQTQRFEDGQPPYDLRTAIAMVLMKTFHQSFTKKLITSSFRATGVHPFDEKLMRQNAIENIGSPPNNNDIT
jgi:hypothetical protein